MVLDKLSSGLQSVLSKIRGSGVVDRQTVREIVKEQVGYLEKIIETRFESTNIRVKALEDTLNTRMDSLEKRIPVIEEMAAIKTRLDELERKLATKAY